MQADVLARYHRLTGKTVRFQTGTDDNALSNVLSARALGVPVEQLVEENSGAFLELCNALDISIDRFLRTTEASHHTAVDTFFRTSGSPDPLVERSRNG